MRNVPDIVVLGTQDGQPFRFQVLVRDTEGESQHTVTMTRSLYEQLTQGKYAPETCIEAAFRFLLDREPKGSILRNFDVAVIPTYFPEFEREFPGYLPAI
jgi:hypothetical protein